MRCLVVYSSLTGNTRMVAEAIHAVMPAGAVLAPVEEAPAPGDFDFIVVGFWADKGEPDKKAQDYIRRISGKKTAVFGTLGAWPDSEHAVQFMDKAEDLLQGNTLCGRFVCQGKVDPKLLKAMEAMPGMAQRHPMTEERRARIVEAAKHPDDNDLRAAAQALALALQKAGESEHA